MVLFRHIIELLHLADDHGRAMRFIVALDGRFMGRTPVDHNLCRDAVTVDRRRPRGESGRFL